MTVEEVKLFGMRADLFAQPRQGKRRVKISGDQVLFHTTWFQNGRKFSVEHSKTTVEMIFSRIERVYDKNGVIIAQRLNRHSNLITTGKGECNRLPTAMNKGIYEHISFQLLY